jgi:hypothetical protein
MTHVELLFTWAVGELAERPPEHPASQLKARLAKA